jgi:signal transduction histidine kinase
VVAWFAFTFSLAVWQAVFSHRTLLQLSSLNPEDAEVLARHTRMVRLESLTLVGLLVVGGIALTLLLRRERKAGERLREFFATFTHELKTSLSSLRLQAEVLEDSLSRSGSVGRAGRILADLTRIDLQLDNSLGLARGDDEGLLLEPVSLKEMIKGLQHAFPLPIHLNRDCELKVDRRAFESILKNVAQNAILHGRAQNLHLDAQEAGDSGPGTRVRLLIEDDGSGSELEERRMGTLFARPGRTSRNGIGLYLVRKFAIRMGGSARFIPRGKRGFGVELELDGRLR